MFFDMLLNKNVWTFGEEWKIYRLMVHGQEYGISWVNNSVLLTIQRVNVMEVTTYYPNLKERHLFSCNNIFENP